MEEYIDYFGQNFGAKVLLGEFGAPIPDINGPMKESEQAKFIDDIFHLLYKKKDNVEGINYWVLSNGSTKLLNDDGSPRQVVEIVKNYFIPGRIRGVVTNSLGERLKEIPVVTNEGYNSSVTDRFGAYTLVIPAGKAEVTIGGNGYKTVTKKFELTRDSEATFDVTLEPEESNPLYRFRLWISDSLEFLHRK